MLVDDRDASPGQDGSRTPNWREWLVCMRCGMNSRQRLMAKLVQQVTLDLPHPRIYLMEQVTPIFDWVRGLPGVEVHGSEYLGHAYQGGQHVGGLRHEDVMQLSYAGDSFDLIVSNDVMEHIPDPQKALQECFRVLKPGGEVLATFPFHVTLERTVVRATLTEDRVAHLLPPQYHGNPVSSDGSLVFHDFGWDLLRQMRAARFEPAVCEFYASDEFGHVGPGLLVFRMRKPATPLTLAPAAPR
jgi:SAM-dependent methyltransferase